MRIKMLSDKSNGMTSHLYLPNQNLMWDGALLVTNFVDDPLFNPEIDDSRDLLNGKGWVKV